MGKGSGALLTANTEAADRIKTDIEIVFASGNSTGDEIIFWAKNVGTKTIKAITDSDIFLTTPSAVSRIAYSATCSAGTAPCWKYSLEGGETDWKQAVTVKVTQYLTSGTTGLHKVLMTVYNAASAEKEFSI